MNSVLANSKTRPSGFTLIEVLIALFILVLIGTTTSKAIIDAAQLKEVLKDETEFSSEFRTSLGFIERDLNQVFNPRWFLDVNLKQIDPFAAPVVAPTTPGTNPAPTFKQLPPEELNRYLKGNAFQSYEHWAAIYDSTGIRASRFKGTDKTMSFVAASHVRIYQQKKESIYAKIKYVVEKQEPNPNLTQEQNQKSANLFQLAKIENTRAFELDDPKEGSFINHYVILNNIKKIVFRYYQAGKKDALTAWDSDQVDQKGKFPEAVEMELELQSPQGKMIDSIVLFKLEAPNDVLPKTY